MSPPLFNPRQSTDKIRTFWRDQILSRPVSHRWLLLGLAFLICHEIFLLIGYVRAPRMDSKAQRYFNTITCERIPHWFLQEMTEKMLLNPEYIPTLAFMSTTANRLGSKSSMVLHAMDSMSIHQTVKPDAIFMIIPEYSIVDRKKYIIPSPHYLNNF